MLSDSMCKIDLKYKRQKLNTTFLISFLISIKFHYILKKISFLKKSRPKKSDLMETLQW